MIERHLRRFRLAVPRRLYVVARANELGETIERIQRLAARHAREVLEQTYTGKLSWILKRINLGSV